MQDTINKKHFSSRQINSYNREAAKGKVCGSIDWRVRAEELNMPCFTQHNVAHICGVITGKIIESIVDRWVCKNSAKKKSPHHV